MEGSFSVQSASRTLKPAHARSVVLSKRSRKSRSISRLKDLDAQLQATRDELALLNPPKDTTDEDTVDAPAHTVGVLTNRAKTHDYSMLLSPPDPARARRLVGARTNALRSVQTLLASRGVDS